MKSLELILENKTSALENALAACGAYPETTSDKIDYAAKLNDYLDQQQMRLKKDIDSLSMQKREYENVQTRLSEFIKTEMREEGLCDIEGSIYKFNLKNSSGSVEISDESLIPDEFFDLKKVLNKTKVKAALTLGQVVEGACINRGSSLTIKAKEV